MLTESAARRMSLREMAGTMSGMPDGTTINAQVATNNDAPAAKRKNKTIIYVSWVVDTRRFLTWLRAWCQSGLSNQIKGKNLTLVPRTAKGFRATVSALRSLDRSKDVSFHTLFLMQDRCVRLLVKNQGRHVHGDLVRKELEQLDICVQGVLQLRRRRHEQETAKARPLQHTSIAIDESALPDQALWFASFGGDVRRPEKNPAVQALSTPRLYPRVLRLCTPVFCLWRGTHLRWMFHLTAAAYVLQLWRKPHNLLPGLCKMERPRRRLLNGRLSNVVSWVVHTTLPPPKRQNGRTVRRAGKSVTWFETRCP
jgi:hypothetical protein